jgi:hypothetical protein
MHELMSVKSRTYGDVEDNTVLELRCEVYHRP